MSPRLPAVPARGALTFPGGSGGVRCSLLSPAGSTRSHSYSGNSGTFPPLKPGEENPVGIPEPQAPAGCSGNAQNAALAYSGLVRTASEERRSVPVFKGLEFSLNARVQDPGSASQLPSARQGAGQSFGVLPMPCRTSALLRCAQRGSGPLPSLLSLNWPARGAGSAAGPGEFLGYICCPWARRDGSPALTAPCHCRQDRSRHKADKVLGFQSQPCRGMCRAIDVLGAGNA